MPTARLRLSVTVLATVLLAAANSPASAQMLRGTVRDSATRLAIPGVVLLLLDGDGRELARNITNERGEYSVRLSPAMSRLRLLRLGFRSRELAIPSATEGAAQLDALMPMLPRLLERVTTVTNPLCPRRSDNETAFALWQQARTGLLATIVAREAKPARSLVLVYSRTLFGTTDRITEQRVFADSGQRQVPFGAAHTASVFMRTGFRTADRDGRHTYYGPDAVVLLESAFQTAHCFSLAADERSRPGQVGLRFAPAARRRGRVDIDGTLWIDTSARALRDIEFRYLGLDPAADRYRPGGHVHFREMPNGVGLVDRWSLRMVTQQVDTGLRLKRGGEPGDWGGMDLTRGRRYSVTDGGAELVSANWPDGTSWRAALGTLRVRVVDAHRTPIAGIRLQLDSTHYAATADSMGYLEITGLLPGPYRAVVVDSSLAAIGIKLETPLSFVASRDSTVEVQVVLRTAEDLVARACGNLGTSPRSHLVIARTVTPDGKPVAGARWRIDTEQGTTDDHGLFRYCAQVDSGSTIQIRVWRERGIVGVADERLVSRAVTRKLTGVRIELPPKS